MLTTRPSWGFDKSTKVWTRLYLPETKKIYEVVTGDGDGGLG